MTDEIQLSRRRFLVGLAAAVAAVPAARALKAAPALMPLGARTGYGFEVLPDPRSMLEVHKQRITVEVSRFGYTRMCQVEKQRFPTSYIPTAHVGVTRPADVITLNPDQHGVWKAGTLEGRIEVRSSPKVLVDENGFIRTIPANTPAVERGKGVLCEAQSHNYLLWSDHPWDNQTLQLAPGDYHLSWYGDGHLVLRSEAVALVRQKGLITERTLIPRRLSNAELAKLTE
jgi:hypothetical protein